MIVKLLAHTALYEDVPGFIDNTDTWFEKDADLLAEQAGRLCYKSWDRPNPKTAENKGYLQNILDHRHFSVLEHGSATFYVDGVTRALLLELERHRFISFSVVSQRYVDQVAGGKLTVVNNPAFKDLSETLQTGLTLQTQNAGMIYQKIYEELRAKGYDKKSARGAARQILPEMTATSLVATANHRAWREIIQKRDSDAADAEIRALAGELLTQLKWIAPNTYQDLE